MRRTYNSISGYEKEGSRQKCSWIDLEGRPERGGIKRERTLRTTGDLVYKDPHREDEKERYKGENDKRENRWEDRERVCVCGKGRRRQGCSRMKQDLITPYNVLLCGCLAYTPVPVCRLMEHREHTIDPLLPPLLLLLLLRILLPFHPPLLLPLRPRGSCRCRSRIPTLKCGWFVCTRHKACLQPLLSSSSSFFAPSLPSASSLGSLCTFICPSIPSPRE